MMILIFNLHCLFTFKSKATLKSIFSYTVEPPITDPPTSRQPLYNRHRLWHQLKLLEN